MDTGEILIWLRDNGVANLTGLNWLITSGSGAGIEAKRPWAHTDAGCRALESSRNATSQSGEIEDIVSSGMRVCLCVFERIGTGLSPGGSNALLNASRIRIALETLETTLQAPELGANGRYSNIRAAALRNVSIETLRNIDEVIPELVGAAATCRRLWSDAINAHPLDWAAFDVEVLHRAAWYITTSVIWKRLLTNGLLESQADQALFLRWRELSADVGHIDAAEMLTVDAHTASLFEDWVRTFENNLTDVEPRTCYVGSASTRMRPGEIDPRTLIIGRGMRTPVTGHGFSDSGFAIFPNVVARAMKLEQDDSRSDLLGTTRVCGGHVSLLDFGLPDLTEEQWQIAISLWRESFEYVEDEPLYRNFTNAINAAAGL